MSNPAYYDRQVPYGYYDQPRQELRSEYGGRPITRAVIQEPEPEVGTGSSRRRIAVAVSVATNLHIPTQAANMDAVLSLPETQDQVQW